MKEQAIRAVLLTMLLVAGSALADSSGTESSAPLKVAPISPAVRLLDVPQQAMWAEQVAESLGWDTSPESSESYSWQVERTLRDKKVGALMLGRIIQNGAPRGGQHVWAVLYRAPSGRLQGVVPLAIQVPYTNITEPTVRADSMKLLGKRGEANRLLWVELVDAFTTVSSEDYTEVKRGSTHLGFVFRVDGAKGEIRCVADDIPLRTTRWEKGAEEKTWSLKVSFPGSGVMKIEPGSEDLPSKMQEWLGVYDVSGKASAPLKESNHGG
ncbi:hypothetical protein JQX13_06910 [Archangium violaceum]|uniref:hypothetical protein n=1 Tax=Archangium violaceum TaxID=83451 RepID=UPI00193B632A|nr:hypothetical protein [Archangium violaceum]QRK09833.1 hypothetical protein JQX13_06910 [Archangium violaceum]